MRVKIVMVKVNGEEESGEQGLSKEKIRLLSEISVPLNIHSTLGQGSESTIAVRVRLVELTWVTRRDPTNLSSTARALVTKSGRTSGLSTNGRRYKGNGKG